MSDMNIEFEYQIRKSLKPWLTSDAAPPTPVEQAPLDQPTRSQIAPSRLAGINVPSPAQLARMPSASQHRSRRRPARTAGPGSPGAGQSPLGD